MLLGFSLLTKNKGITSGFICPSESTLITISAPMSIAADNPNLKAPPTPRFSIFED